MDRSFHRAHELLAPLEGPLAVNVEQADLAFQLAFFAVDVREATSQGIGFGQLRGRDDMEVSVAFRIEVGEETHGLLGAH